MKKLFLLFLFISSCLTAQVDEVLFDDNWPVGNAKIIYGTEVMRVEGKNSTESFTNLCYKTYEQCVERFKKDSEAQMWTAEKTEAVLSGAEKHNRGGSVQIYIGRPSVTTGNYKNFTLIIKDSANVEVFRKQLDSKVPQVPNGDRMWTNIVSVRIDTKLSGKVSVYLIDALSLDPRYQFAFTVK